MVETLKPMMPAIAAPDPALGEGSLELRPLGYEHLAAVEAALADPEIARWFDDVGLTAAALVERATLRWTIGEAAELAVLDTGSCVGSIWLHLGPHGRASVGYWLVPPDAAEA
jgi:hypothetical protein